MKIKNNLDRLYLKYNRRRYVHPDPLEFLYNYPDAGDREIAGFIASSLAYGRVAQILDSVSRVLDKMPPSLRMFLAESDPSSLKKTFRGFRHRFADDGNLTAMLSGLKHVVDQYGSLHACFLEGIGEQDETGLKGLKFFSGEIISECGGNPGHLVPSVEK